MSAPVATLGLYGRPRTNCGDFLIWAAANGCRAEADRLVNVLLAQISSVWLGNIVDLLASQSVRLRKWAESGGQIYGLDRLATKLVSQERLAVTGGRRIQDTNIRQDFVSDAKSFYLQISLLIGNSHDLTHAHIETLKTLRMWLLVEALHRSVRGIPLDKFVEDAARELRLTSKSSRGDARQIFLDGMESVRDMNLDGIRIHMMSTEHWFAAGKIEETYRATSNKMARAFARLAHGNSAPLEAWPLEFTPIPEVVEDVAISWPTLPAEEFEDLYPAEPARPAPEPADKRDEDEDDSDTDDDKAAYDVDPSSSTHQQHDSARHIYLAIAAQARLIAWRWESINPSELTHLRRKIAEAYASPDPSQRALASIVDVALAAGRSLHESLALPVAAGETDSGELTVELVSGVLRRRSPRRTLHLRTSHAWIDRVRQPAGSIACALPEPCARALRELHSIHPVKAGVTRLGDLWRTTWGTPSLRFLSWMQDDPITARLRPGMLGSVAEQEIFRTSDDWLLGRLLVSRTDGEGSALGLPAAASYAAYDAVELAAAAGACWFGFGPADSNVAGSLIDAPDLFYAHGFARLREAIQEASALGQVFRHHNLVMLYWDAALLAASGARPVDGLWSWANIDFSDAFAFVDDKTSVDDSPARWVPLPHALLRSLQLHLMHKHVPRVQALLRVLFGSRAERTIELLERGLCWIGASREGLNIEPWGERHRKEFSECSPQSPLPINAMRHRARTTLRRLGCEQELIDSYLGHSDGATRTHGDFSPRRWLADAKSASACLNQAWENLDVQLPHLPPASGVDGPIGEVALVPTSDAPSSTSTLAWRQEHRWRTLLHACREAAETLSFHALRNNPKTDAPRFIGLTMQRLKLSELSAHIGQWSEDQGASAVGDLMRTPRGMPATLGRFRMLFLGRMVDRAWREHGRRSGIKRRVFADLVADRSRATATAVGARARLQNWRRVLDEIWLAQGDKPLRPIQATALLFADLIIECRVTDRLFLEGVLRGHARMVSHGDRPCIEWTPDEFFPWDGHGVVRCRVLARSATLGRFLARPEVARQRLLSSVSSLLGRLRSSVGLDSAASYADLLERMTETIEAVNSLELPGNVAAARAGRLRTVSLSWPDWTRRPDGTFCCPAPPSSRDPDGDDDDEQDTSAAPGWPARVPLDSETLELQEAAREFRNALRNELTKHRQGGADRTLTQDDRKTIQRSVGALCRQHASRVSPAMLDLGDWVEALLMARRRGSRLLALSSVRTYFSSLSQRFEGLMYAADLAVLDEDDLTELYQAIVDAGGVERPSYVLARLKEFHRHVQRRRPVATPDWSDIVAEDFGLGTSPGDVDESAYLRVFESVADTTDLLVQASAAAMFFAFRYGLRRAEAVLVRVRDLIDVDGRMHVIVSKTERKSVKTKRARRVVPQLFNMSESEFRFLEGLRLLGAQRVREDRDALLLVSDIGVGGQHHLDAVSRMVSQLLRQLGSERLTLHHLRHSFARRVWSALELPASESRGQPDEAESLTIRRIVLGSESIGRRSPWGLASVLGHAHPSQTYRSYIHVLQDRADELIHESDQTLLDRRLSLEGIVDLDAFVQVPTMLDTAHLQPHPPSRPDAVKVLMCIKLLSNGVFPAKVSHSLKVDIRWLEQLDSARKEIDRRIGIESADAQDVVSIRYPKVGAGLLSHVHLSATGRIEQALQQAQNAWPSDESSTCIPSHDEFCAMFGYRREFAMWLPSQMDFLRRALASLGLWPHRVKGKMHPGLHDSVKNEATMRLPEIFAVQDANAKISLPDSSTGRPIEPTWFGQPPIRIVHRISVAVNPDNAGHLRDRYELALAMLALWGCNMSASMSMEPTDKFISS